MRNPNHSALEQRLGYTFKDAALLELALTHRSYAQVDNNERLEFLGDSIVNFIIGEALYLRCPKEPEGRLTRLRANLINGETLAAIAAELALGPYLHLGGGESKSGGHKRPSILADALEAIIAAIYLDANIEICKPRVLIWFESRLTEEALSQSGKDPKSVLQEFVQARQFQLPGYETLHINGDAHAQEFHVCCTVPGLPHRTTGIGTNRRRAEQDAAEKFLSLVAHTIHNHDG